MHDKLNFDDLTPIEISVSYKKKRYLLCEATEDAVRQFRNKVTSCTDFIEGKMSGIKGPIADAGSFLVSLCLRELGDTGERGSLVALDTFRSWPHRVTGPIIEKLKEISGIAEEDDTSESLEKEAAVIQEKLTALRGDPLGNVSDATTEPSG